MKVVNTYIRIGINESESSCSRSMDTKQNASSSVRHYGQDSARGVDLSIRLDLQARSISKGRLPVGCEAISACEVPVFASILGPEMRTIREITREHWQEGYIALTRIGGATS